MLALVVTSGGCDENKPDIEIIAPFEPTEEPTFTATPYPTNTPEPTNTPTPEPTATPVPPTATRVPPTSTPRPIPPTLVPTRIPTQRPSEGVLPPAPPIAAHNPVAEFIRGYEAAGGPVQYLYNIVTYVVQCESEWNPNAYNAAGPYYGLMQFDMVTWNEVGGGNIYSPYQQGVNTARVLNSYKNPRSTWPGCWIG